MSVRNVLFWIHLTAGILSGLAIAIMCFTGTVLAFEKELTAWSERDARRVIPPDANASRLTIDELQRRWRAAHPEARPANLVLQNDPTTAVAFTTGRTGATFVDPYTGEVRQPKSSLGAFMQEMVEWHRYLNFTGEVSRPRGKWINGVCNLAFCVLAITGLYLWMPRSWSWRAVHSVIWFRANTTGKARDFNWHNAIGFWTAPVLIVLTLTAVPISFRWGGNLIVALTGAPTSTPPGAAPGNATAPEFAPPTAGAQPLSQDDLLKSAQTLMPEWKTITLRLGGAASGGRSAVPRVEPFTVTVRERATWPRTATTTLTLNPYTGDVLRRSGYAELNAAQQVRSWTRFLHTGEALGWAGQLVAGIACLGGVFLVYTGFALSWRRFFGQRASGREAGAVETPKSSAIAESRR